MFIQSKGYEYVDFTHWWSFMIFVSLMNMLLVYVVIYDDYYSWCFVIWCYTLLMIPFLVYIVTWGYMGFTWTLHLYISDVIVGKGLTTYDNMNSYTCVVVMTLHCSCFCYLILICYYSCLLDLMLLLSILTSLY